MCGGGGILCGGGGGDGDGFGVCLNLWTYFGGKWVVILGGWGRKGWGMDRIMWWGGGGWGCVMWLGGCGDGKRRRVYFRWDEGFGFVLGVGV